MIGKRKNRRTWNTYNILAFEGALVQDRVMQSECKSRKCAAKYERLFAGVVHVCRLKWQHSKSHDSVG